MSKWPRGSKIQIAKMSKLQKVIDVKNPKAPPRDPCYPSYQEIQVSKSFLEKSTLSGADEPYIVKANIVQACNQKRVCPALQSIS